MCTQWDAEVAEVVAFVRSYIERSVPCNRPSLNRVRGAVASRGLSWRSPLAPSLLEFAVSVLAILLSVKRQFRFSSSCGAGRRIERRAALRKVLSPCAWPPLTSYSLRVDVEADGSVLPTFDVFHTLVHSAAGVGAWCNIVTARLQNSDVSHALWRL